MRRQHKYGAVVKVVDNIRFASTAEATRYSELKLLEKAGEISHLELQPVYPLFVPYAGEKRTIGKYVGDFYYYDEQTAAWVVEDVKGFKTPLYSWKKKHVEAQYGITIVEVI